MPPGSRRRLRAVFLITVTGYGVALLFLIAGAPDVATTQVLVETAMTVVLVLVMRRLPIHFSRRPLQIGAWGRWGIAIATAVVLCGGTLYAADARYREALGPGLIEAALHDRRRAQRRQRDPGRRPCLGHHGRDRGAAGGRHRRGVADLRHPP